jgi:hypothetical protein
MDIVVGLIVIAVALLFVYAALDATKHRLHSWRKFDVSRISKRRNDRPTRESRRKFLLGAVWIAALSAVFTAVWLQVCIASFTCCSFGDRVAMSILRR